MKLTKLQKAAIAILLGLLVAWLFGCSCPPPPPVPKPPSPEHYVVVAQASEGLTDLDYLKGLYKTYNESYFHNRLTQKITIQINNDIPDMANTMCDDAVKACTMNFNLEYVLAPRVSEFTMLHEQCHVKTWHKDLDDFGTSTPHGKVWRSCMLQLDMEGAFREIIIDNYVEEMSTWVK